MEKAAFSHRVTYGLINYTIMNRVNPRYKFSTENKFLDGRDNQLKFTRYYYPELGISSSMILKAESDGLLTHSECTMKSGNTATRITIDEMKIWCNKLKREKEKIRLHP